MEIISDLEFTENETRELNEVARLFYPIVLEDNIKIKVDFKTKTENLLSAKIEVFDIENEEEKQIFEFENNYVLDAHLNIYKAKKLAMYDALSKLNKVEFPWGDMTGIRPTKIAYDYLKSGGTKLGLNNLYKNYFRVSEKNANLVLDIIENQKPIETNPNLIDLYINIPFCTTRCSYCSFISAEIGKIKDMVTPYVDALIKEIEATKKLINEKNYVVKTIYIGGGTPTSLDPKNLERLLEHIGYDVNEFTVEAGRPDTINEEKLEILKKYKVTRICVNPQSFDDKVLKTIGRNHSAMDTINAYKLAQKFGFIINMDLIAGLPKETLKGFKNNIDIVLHLNPDNITVHTLALKRTSSFDLSRQNIFKQTLTEKMVDYAHEKLTANKYLPYYLYRQKYMLDNLQNIGYCKRGTACRFNIDSMEDTASILACGANGVSKRIFFDENRIERAGNVKDIKLYIERIDEMIERKKELFK